MILQTFYFRYIYIYQLNFVVVKKPQFSIPLKYISILVRIILIYTNDVVKYWYKWAVLNIYNSLYDCVQWITTTANNKGLPFCTILDSCDWHTGCDLGYKLKQINIYYYFLFCLISLSEHTDWY